MIYLVMNAELKQMIGLNIIWLCIIIFGSLLFGGDEPLKTKIQIMVGLESFLLLMQAGIFFLIV